MLCLSLSLVEPSSSHPQDVNQITQTQQDQINFQDDYVQSEALLFLPKTEINLPDENWIYLKSPKEFRKTENQNSWTKFSC
jgi:hypothetical protein